MDLNEITAPQLRKQDDPSFLRKKQRVRELGRVGSAAIVDRFVRGSSTLYFKTASSKFGQNGRVYEQGIKFLDMSRALKDPFLTTREAVREALFDGDVKVFCTCPAQKYWGFQFIDTTLNAAIRRNTNYPSIRNPALKGTVCKHLHQALQVLPFNAGFIMKEVRLRRESQTERRKSRKNEQAMGSGEFISFMNGDLTAQELVESFTEA